MPITGKLALQIEGSRWVSDEYQLSDDEKEEEFETAIDHLADMKLRVDFENEYTPEERTNLASLKRSLKDSLKRIKAEGVDIGVDTFNSENKEIARKHKERFAGYLADPKDITSSTIVEGVHLKYYKTGDKTLEKFFIKTFIYKKNIKGSSAAIFAKILSEIYYQKEAGCAAARAGFFIVPRIFSHGRITALAGTPYDDPSEDDEQYYIKMEYFDMEHIYVSLRDILEDDMKKIKVRARAFELCETITKQLGKINDSLIENKIYHNDLPNTDNILLNKIKYDETGTIEIVIIDFGEASSTQGFRSDYNPHQLCLGLKESGSTSIKGGKSKTKKQKKTKTKKNKKKLKLKNKKQKKTKNKKQKKQKQKNKNKKTKKNKK